MDPLTLAPPQKHRCPPPSLPEPPSDGESSFTYEDAKRLCLILRCKEKLLDKNKRLAMRLAGGSTSQGNPKRRKKTRVVDKCVSFDNVRGNVESHFGLSRAAPVTPLLLSAIHRTLEVLDQMPSHDLVVVNRKLRGANDVPQIQPVRRNGHKRDLLLGRVLKRCIKFLSTLEEGANLPIPFSKALSVMCLSMKYNTRCIDIPTSGFFSFSNEIIALQNDIVRALWSLPKVRFHELKGLQDQLDPEDKISRQSFRRVLKQYLVDCLFECCDEVDIPDELRRTLDFINRTSRRRILVCSKEMMEEETKAVLNMSSQLEAVLNMSSQLKQVAQYLLQRSIIDEALSSPSSDLLESDEGTDSNDFDLAANNYCSSFSECNSYTNDKMEGSGDSMLVYT